MVKTTELAGYQQYPCNCAHPSRSHSVQCQHYTARAKDENKGFAFTIALHHQPARKHSEQ
jgi:hypothetical protein